MKHMVKFPTKNGFGMFALKDVLIMKYESKNFTVVFTDNVTIEMSNVEQEEADTLFEHFSRVKGNAV